MTQHSISQVAKEDALLKAMVTDLSGRFRELLFPIKYIKELCEIGMAYDGSSFTGINGVNESDSVLLGDIDTLMVCPENIQETDKKEYWIICDIYSRALKPHRNCVRSKLKEMQEILGEKWNGGELFLGAEPESYIIDPENFELLSIDGTNDNYFNPHFDKSFLIAEITNSLEELDFCIERSHSEVGEDQIEINWRFDTAHRTCDKIQIFKLVSSKVARKFGLEITFLPKPYPNRNGSGMHFHISVINKTKNLFYGEDEKNYNFNTEALHFLQGILDNVKSLAPISNKAECSYARLIPGFEAPNVIGLGAINRSTACRIPIIPDEKARKKGLRAEFRFPDPLANPYLLASSFIIMGLEGLKKKTKFKGFTTENLFKYSYNELLKKGYDYMPRNLWEAYHEYLGNKALKAGLGDSMYDSYKELIIKEIDESQPYGNIHSMEKHLFS